MGYFASIFFPSPEARELREIALNSTGLLPGLGTVSGAVRIVGCGVLQGIADVVVGIAAFHLGGLAALCDEREFSQRCFSVTKQAIGFFGHDLLNIFRGIIELPGIFGLLLWRIDRSSECCRTRCFDSDHSNIHCTMSDHHRGCVASWRVSYLDCGQRGPNSYAGFLQSHCDHKHRSTWQDPYYGHIYAFDEKRHQVMVRRYLGGSNWEDTRADTRCIETRRLQQQEATRRDDDPPPPELHVPEEPLENPLSPPSPQLGTAVPTKL
jgi:hypothetical protein